MSIPDNLHLLQWHRSCRSADNGFSFTGGFVSQYNPWSNCDKNRKAALLKG
jgi:hypothetical protein